MSSERIPPGPFRSCPPTLLIFCDSLSYYGPQGGLPSDDPRIWPNIVARQLGWDVELIGRIGWTSRDVWWAATQDPRAWAALPRAGAVIFATSGMDSLPSPLPTALRELIRYVRPSWLRRWVRDGYGWAQPKFSPMARPALPPHLTVEYLEMTRGAIDFNRPGIPIVASMPSVHIAPTYGMSHRGRRRHGRRDQRMGGPARYPGGRPESGGGRRGPGRPRQSRTASTGISKRIRASPT